MPNTDVQTAAKVHTHTIMCSGLLTYRNRNYDAFSK